MLAYVERNETYVKPRLAMTVDWKKVRPFVPTVKVAQISVNNQSRRSFRLSIISRKLKFCSLARGALGGSRAWMNFFSRSVNQFAVSGTKRIFLVSGWSVERMCIRVHRKNLQSGSRNQITTPNRTVAMPSVRKSLEEFSINQGLDLRKAPYHCHPESPPAPDTVSNA